MDYSKLSDQEINMAVAEIFHPDSVVIESKSRPPSACITGRLPSLLVDYCNNPADAWPIIVERKINIEWHEWKNSEWMPYALNNATMKSCYATNPLRAAMITFLMMQDSANVQTDTTR